MTSVPGPYLTPEQLRSRIAPGDDTTGTAATLGDPELVAAIAGAQTEVDARLAARYRLPFGDPPPALVVQITAELAVLRATLTYRKSRDLAQYDPVVIRARDARALLQHLVTGHADLLEVDGSQSPSAPGGGFGDPINPNDGDMFCLDDFGLGARSVGRYRDAW